ncbi:MULTISPECIES: carbohydrate ABC transporter permease [Streptomyces]|uniref:Sugar ABC transporter permease n=1 Tax=Streptomyces dengpaensis TaxID=2049881 RepID=A0ABN5IC91_9ACTN|nr:MULTISPECIES: sugar ABC transporter permease [Streptomyces]AVH60179.1 sugar ABC transporter permease [Streptomyces dengpaensis]AVH60611.1 sugar ABC transporter permease [Streptomyces dengpaensis]PIA98498.1 ABC transporter permease [Streptomyces sp. HG99]
MSSTTSGTHRLRRAAGAARRALGPRQPWRLRLGGHQPVGMLFVSPYLLYLAAIFVYPLGFAVWMSFHDYFFAAPGVQVDRPFVGLDNYTTVLTDPDVWRSFVNIAVFLVINVPLTVVASLVLASALNKKLRFRSFFRTAYYIPYITASVAVVGVWLFLFNTNGLVNQALGPLAPDPSWLVNSHLAMPVVAVFVAWKQLGFFVVLYLTALQNVPNELYESAALDGAGRFRTFRSITVPTVRPATLLVLILATITGANLFTEPYLLTSGGGPDGATTSPVLLMYQRGLQQGHPDEAAAIGVILVVLITALSLIYRRFLERD